MKEEIAPSLRDFVICFWEMQPKIDEDKAVKDLVLIDGCTELGVNWDTKWIGYAAPSMTKTACEETTYVTHNFIAAKLKPGAFTQLTGLPAKAIQDHIYLDLKDVDQNSNPEILSTLSYEKTKVFLEEYLKNLICNKMPNDFVTLFDELCDSPPKAVTQLYERFHFSPRHYGNSPQMVMTILRFQYCLHLITSGQKTPRDILELIQFSDQSHFIREFKKYIRLAPYEYLKKYQDGVFVL